jgi:Protein of unknown function (DUF1573)
LCLLTVLAAAGWGLGGPAPSTNPREQPPSCGVLCLFDLCTLAGRPLTPQQRTDLVGRYPEPSCSMADLLSIGGTLGLRLVAVEGTLEELGGVQGPKIIHLKDPNHFAVLAASSSTSVQLLSEGRVLVGPRAEVAARYTGHAIILEGTGGEPGPRLDLPEFDYEFGLQGVGQKVGHAFRITNSGDADLTINVQRRSCAGPTATLSRQVVPPGESAALTLELELRSGGVVNQFVTLLTSDLARPVAYVTIRGYAPLDLLVTPDRLYLPLDGGRTSAREVVVSGPHDMRLLGAKCGSGDLLVSVSEPTHDPDANRWVLTLSLRHRRLPGTATDTLTITTSHPGRPIAILPITVEVRGDLEVTPATAFLGFLPADEVRSMTIALRSRSGKPFRLRSAVLSDASVGEVRRSRVSPGEFEVVVTLRSPEPRTIDTELVLTTDVKGEGRLGVPVYAQVVRAH